jgi:hypothetical protein
VKSFSERLGYSRAVVIDEAPQWLRVAYSNTMLVDFVDFGTGRDYKYPTRILLVADLMTEIGISTQTTIGRPPFPSSRARQALEELFSELRWEHFYESLEITYRLLRTDSSATAILYLKMLNDLFSRGNIAWQMTSRGELTRTLPPDVTAIEYQLGKDEDLGDPVKVHLLKARKFLDSKPSDPPNVIKESLQALESFARTKTDTKSLGDALKAWKRADLPIPPLLISAMEKLYGFASAEAGVRHGSPDEERLVREDAEFVYFIALATLRYLRGIE